MKITPTPPSPVEGEGYREGRHFHIKCETPFITLVLTRGLDPVNPFHVRSQRLRYEHAAIGLLKVFQYGH